MCREIDDWTLAEHEDPNNRKERDWSLAQIYSRWDLPPFFEESDFYHSR